MTLTIIFPVHNEHLRLERGIDKCVRYIRDNISIPVRIVIVDNGSEDDTQQIGLKLAKEYTEVSYRRIEEKGVGVAFRTGIMEADTDIVGYMDVDLSTDLKHLSEMIGLFERDTDLQYVNGSRFSKEASTKGRKWYRKITSNGLLFLLDHYLGMRSTDALCGFTFLKTETARKLVGVCSDDCGWFYTVEFLIRAERMGVSIVEIPVEWIDDHNTTVKVIRTIADYLVKMKELKKQLDKETRKNA